MSCIAELQKKFGSDTIRFVSGKGGLTDIEVKTPLAEALISTHGAHVMKFIPAGQKPVLWMSDSSWFEAGKPIRGGVPVCWPWFGAGSSEADPAHGFARLSEWRVRSASTDAAGVARIELVLTEKEVTPAQYGSFPFELTMTVTVGTSLEMKLTSWNKSDKPLSLTEALHTYFNVSDAEKITVRGLDQVAYLNRVVGAVKVEGNVQQGDVVIGEEVDRVYLNTVAALELCDPGFGRIIRVEKSGSKATVIWNPWIAKSQRMPDFGDNEYHTMLCIEAVNVCDDARTVLPGEKHTLIQKITVL